MAKNRRTDGSGRPKMIPFITALAIVWMLGSAPAAPQDPAAQKTSEQVFKNIQVMKGVPVDDFLGSMGIMCAALGFDCSDCHTGAGTEKVDWAADTPEKMRARTMVQMMQTQREIMMAGVGANAMPDPNQGAMFRKGTG